MNKTAAEHHNDLLIQALDERVPRGHQPISEEVPPGRLDAILTAIRLRNTRARSWRFWLATGVGVLSAVLFISTVFTIWAASWYQHNVELSWYADLGMPSDQVDESLAYIQDAVTRLDAPRDPTSMDGRALLLQAVERQRDAILADPLPTTLRIEVARARTLGDLERAALSVHAIHPGRPAVEEVINGQFRDEQARAADILGITQRLLTVKDPDNPTVAKHANLLLGRSQTVVMRPEMLYRFTLPVKEYEHITITAKHAPGEGSIDPYVILFDDESNRLQENDDAHTATFDSALTFQAPYTGTVTVMVGVFGQSGRVVVHAAPAPTGR